MDRVPNIALKYAESLTNGRFHINNVIESVVFEWRSCVSYITWKSSPRTSWGPYAPSSGHCFAAAVPMKSPWMSKSLIH